MNSGWALFPVVLSSHLLLAGTGMAGSKLVYMHEMADVKKIILADDDGRNPQEISEPGVWALYPDITSDGRYVSYSRGNEVDLGIVVRDLTLNQNEEWTAVSGMYLHSSFSGDGRFLSFSGPVGEQNEQRIAIIDLKSQRPLLQAAARDGTPFTPQVRTIHANWPAYFPALSSSGNFVVFQRSKGQIKDIVKHNLETGEEILLSPEDGYAMAPALSRDDRFVAYTARVDGIWDIYLHDLMGGGVTRLTDTPFLDYAPTFKADGSLVYAANPNGNFELFEISARSIADGTFIARPLIQGAGDHYAPALSGETQYALGGAPRFPDPERSSFGAISHQGKIYMAGGHQGPEHTYPPESFMDRLEIYDPAEHSWKQGANLSLARHGFSLAAHGNYIYAFGGFTFSADHQPGWKSVDLIERYDIAADKWTVIGNLPRNRSSNVVAKVGTKVFIIGGWDSTPPLPGSTAGQFHDEIDMFDLETETVSTLAVKLPAPRRRALSAVVQGEEIILIGGIGEGVSHFDLLDQVTAFNTRTYSWRDLPKLPFATFAPAAGIIDGEMFVFGGMFKTGPMDFVYVNHIYSLLPGAPAWLHTGRHLSENKGFSQVVDLEAGMLGILGGHTYVGDEDHPVSTFEVFGKTK